MSYARKSVISLVGRRCSIGGDLLLHFRHSRHHAGHTLHSPRLTVARDKLDKHLSIKSMLSD